MPHRCMECKNVLENGEVDLNTGCPVCGGKKFQYIRAKKGPLAPEAAQAERDVHAKPAAKAKAGAKDEKRERIESVRILEKGSYEINLPVLLSRKGVVMSKEDGVYVVDLPSALKTPKKKKHLKDKDKDK